MYLSYKRYIAGRLGNAILLGIFHQWKVDFVADSLCVQCLRSEFHVRVDVYFNDMYSSHSLLSCCESVPPSSLESKANFNIYLNIVVIVFGTDCSSWICRISRRTLQCEAHLLPLALQ
ncbi:hypothetical protein OS493_034078 [Desmophyllum pertusum]|uniref:Uncharacterized protein n=1 Tax=Desmophyllum pertusum TaxID=174260 RepID=A0A9W9YYT2_9CNID|nr:hypothetical protein OS493_034077 [Desmophyllum pertusum]KAJ7370149.1 hypothetical protein OS493_034078 [Desmophyllum pertusum]